MVREKRRSILGLGVSRLWSRKTPASDSVVVDAGDGNDGVDPENGSERTPPPAPQRRATLGERVSALASNGPVFVDTPRNTSMTPVFGPLPLVAVLSFCITVSLIATGIYWNDGTAIIAICIISLASSVIGYAAWWTPVLTGARHLGTQAQNTVPGGDVVIRTREGAFCVIQCSDSIARELYSGDQECRYHVEGVWYRLYMTAAAVLIMPSVILLGNCTFNMQALIGAAYMTLNIAYWGIGLLAPQLSWDLSRYEVLDITPSDARDAHRISHVHGYSEDARVYEDPEARPSYARTLWFVIRETKRAAWVMRSGTVPLTVIWSQWCDEAEKEAQRGNRGWKAVSRKDELLGTNS